MRGRTRESTSRGFTLSVDLSLAELKHNPCVFLTRIKPSDTLPSPGFYLPWRSAVDVTTVALAPVARGLFIQPIDSSLQNTLTLPARTPPLPRLGLARQGVSALRLGVRVRVALPRKCVWAPPRKCVCERESVCERVCGVSVCVYMSQIALPRKCVCVCVCVCV